MNYFEEVKEDEYLSHHGILGQKWGVRRYQNKDGSLTPLGEKHWDELNDQEWKKVSEEKRTELKKKAVDSGDIKKIQNKVDEFSADEIKTAMTNFDTRKKLNELNQKSVEEGRKKVTDTIQYLSDVAGKGTDLYNKVAKISNAFADTDLPIIGEKKDQKSKLEKETEQLKAQNNYLTEKQRYAKATYKYKDVTEEDLKKMNQQELEAYSNYKKSLNEATKYVNGESNKKEKNKDKGNSNKNSGGSGDGSIKIKDSYNSESTVKDSYNTVNNNNTSNSKSFTINILSNNKSVSNQTVTDVSNSGPYHNGKDWFDSWTEEDYNKYRRS